MFLNTYEDNLIKSIPNIPYTLHTFKCALK